MDLHQPPTQHLLINSVFGCPCKEELNSPAAFSCRCSLRSSLIVPFKPPRPEQNFEGFQPSVGQKLAELAIFNCRPCPPALHLNADPTRTSKMPSPMLQPMASSYFIPLLCKAMPGSPLAVSRAWCQNWPVGSFCDTSLLQLGLAHPFKAKLELLQYSLYFVQ